MKVTLSLEKTCSSDVSIVVDTLRASTTITMAFNNFKKVIPTFTPEEAKKIAKKENAILAGERKGSKLNGFDIGNSPEEVENYKTEKDTLVITTSNGTRIMEEMDSTVLIGSFVNGKAVANAALDLANTHIDIVMAGYKGDFALEDYLGAGEILYWINKELKTNTPINKSGINTKNEIYKEKTKNIENIKTINSNKNSKIPAEKWKLKKGISEYAQSAILGSRDFEAVKNSIENTRSGRRLTYLGSKKDIEFCLQKNITNNVAIYQNKELKLYKKE